MHVQISEPTFWPHTRDFYHEFDFKAVVVDKVDPRTIWVFKPGGDGCVGEAKAVGYQCISLETGS